MFLVNVILNSLRKYEKRRMIVKKLVLGLCMSILGMLTVNATAVKAEVVGDYAQAYHLNPKNGFMNDIQSVFYNEQTKEYNLYYLHNKDYATGGNGTEWEHVSTKDFVTYKNLGTAIPKYQTSTGDIASGTLYRDYDNRLGFGANALISYVTSYGDGQQTQNIWYSLDNGNTFKPYANNPIMKPMTKDADFRDPYVFRLGDTFYMYLAEGNKIGVYESKDGINFSYKDGIYSQIDQLGLLECPNLFELTTTDTGEKKWVLLVGGNGYKRNETTGTYYVVGSLKDGVFQPETQARRIDSGSDFYGAKFMQQNDSQLLGLAWLGSWDYNNKVNSTNGSLGSMSMARTISFTSENNYTLKTSAFQTGNLFKKTVLNRTVSTKQAKGDSEGYKTVLATTLNQKGFALDLAANATNATLPSHIHVEVKNDDSYFKLDFDTTNGYYMITRNGQHVTDVDDANAIYNAAHVAKVDTNSTTQFNAKLFVDGGSIELYFPNSGNTYSLAKFSTSMNNQVSIKMNGDAKVSYKLSR